MIISVERMVRTKFRTRLIAGLLLGAASLSLSGLGACSSDPPPEDLTSLKRSADISFFCLDPEGKGAPLLDCPQGGRTIDDGLTVGAEGYELHGLITQTLSNEVAVVRISGEGRDGYSTGKVLDADFANPGVTPLRVNGPPVDIVTTPGGRASFAAVAAPALAGIFALPTSCVLAPEEGEQPRDLTSWPACSLPSAPGAMVMLVDRHQTGGVARRWCGQEPDADLPRAREGAECSVDLSEEKAYDGPRKIAVTLPEEGKIVVLDAQEILSREPGTYAPCHIESELELSAVVPESIKQPLPDDLVQVGQEPFMVYDQLGGTYEPSPAGMAEREGTLLVADNASPVIQRIDSRDPCELAALEPLFATSFTEPNRVVTTSRVAISPRTPSGSRFAYAVDHSGDDLSNVIVYDLSVETGERTPLVRSGSPLIPHEAPDRIEFSSGVKDVAFALTDQPIRSPVDGIAVTGTLCNPDPSTTSDSIATEYRRTAGAATLRGLFGYALLGNGRLAIIDIEDFDAACRRPVSVNRSSEMDFRGCVADETEFEFFTEDGTKEGSPTVTEDVSCRAVLPHRARSRYDIFTEEGGSIYSPALRGFGRLSKRGRGLSVSRLTAEGKKNPILLGVNFDAPGSNNSVPAQVRIGSALWERGTATDSLKIDPNIADQIAPVLPFIEPRAYPPEEGASVTYEGAVAQTRKSGFLRKPSGADEAAVARFEDPTISFCSLGVQGEKLTKAHGIAQFDLTGGILERFVARHTDYIQVANLLPNVADPYWQSAGAQCGRDSQFVEDTGYVLCDSIFGQGDEDDLLLSRDLAVVSAHDEYLQLRPRGSQSRTAEEHLALLSCCFPQALDYRIRAGHQWVAKGELSGFEHSIITDELDEEGACIFDPSPRSSLLRGRAFEVSSTKCDELDPEQGNACGVGMRTPEDVVCSYDATSGPIEVDGVASECIFDSLTRRFAVYRGLEPSSRDQTFTFEVSGGFVGRAISLAPSNASTILPMSLTALPSFGAMAVVDSQNFGLIMVDVANSYAVQRYF